MQEQKIELGLPVKHVFINQPFGVNYLDFYQKLGMLGHNGIDFKAFHGCPLLAAHDGEIIIAGKDVQGGIEVDVWDSINKFKTLDYHLLDLAVKVGDKVKRGDLLGHADNTGIYTTGDHDHFGLKMTDDNGNTINKNNGYGGGINPAPYFKYFFDGTPLNNKDWDKSRSYHRYGKPRNWLAEFYLRFAPIGIKNQWTASGQYIQKRLKAIGYQNPSLNGEQINAIIYGAWDFETVINPGMYESHWGYLTKDEYNKGEKAFLSVVNN